MSYNISSIKYIGPGKLTITATDLCRAVLELSGKTPARCFIEDRTNLRTIAPDVFQVEMVEWCGEGANNTDDFHAALSYTEGLADLLIIWEGGDSISGLRVNDGEVTEHDVVMSLGEEVE